MNDLRQIALLDTATASTNVGDRIIMDSVLTEIGDLFPKAFVQTAASHDYMGAKSRGHLIGSDLAIAAGTNLLSSRMWFRAPWKLRPWDGFRIDNVVLMGCGWYQYQRTTDPYSSWLLRSVLSSDACHSVRDNYTLKKLNEIGIRNVVNTGCPTLWRLQPADCESLPKDRAEEVVTTVNTYIPDRDADGRMLRMLADRYRRVHLWPQTRGDWAYARDLLPGLDLVSPSLGAFDRLLESSASLDYVGNRLHGGIRALQKGRRAVVVEIDNRAAEMGRDFGLPTVQRTAFDKLEEMIDGPLEIRVAPPTEAITTWKDQFRQ